MDATVNVNQRRLLLPEWHEQWGVMLAWPHHSTDWVDNLDAAEQCYVKLVGAIVRFEKVLLLCQDATHRLRIETRLTQDSIALASIVFVEIPYDDTWARDFGFITITSETGLRLLDFEFTAWGGKFAASQDNGINRVLFRQSVLASCDTEAHDLVLEGGSIETDGLGTLLTTRRCLLNPNRNPDLSESEIEERLTQALGVSRVLWLSHGYLEGDDTDAHIDTLARFVNPTTLVHLSCSDPADSHFAELQAMTEELAQLTQLDGSPYTLIAIDIQPPIYRDKRRLGASYVNFLMVNEAVLVPIYGHPESDQAALQAIELACPDRTVVPINCLPLIEQNGSLHCVTMQIPKGVITGDA